MGFPSLAPQVCLIMGLMPLLTLGPAVLLLWEGRSKETKGVKGQASTDRRVFLFFMCSFSAVVRSPRS